MLRCNLKWVLVCCLTHFHCNNVSEYLLLEYSISRTEMTQNWRIVIRLVACMHHTLICTFIAQYCAFSVVPHITLKCSIECRMKNEVS